jgi:hypothetical protein
MPAGPGVCQSTHSPPRTTPSSTGHPRWNGTFPQHTARSSAVIHIRCPLIHNAPSGCDPPTRPLPEMHASFRADQGCARR